MIFFSKNSTACEIMLKNIVDPDEISLSTKTLIETNMTIMTMFWIIIIT